MEGCAVASFECRLLLCGGVVARHKPGDARGHAKVVYCRVWGGVFRQMQRRNREARVRLSPTTTLERGGVLCVAL